MRINRRLLLTAVAAMAISLLAALPGYAQTVPAPGESPTVDKIKAAGKLRAGVAIAWPWLGQDPSTGKYIGATADLGEKIAKTLGVEIEYVPSGWDVIVAGRSSKVESEASARAVTICGVETSAWLSSTSPTTARAVPATSS
jgi:ABC-type amino acid transport substrate-binding protein